MVTFSSAISSVSILPWRTSSFLGVVTIPDTASATSVMHCKQQNRENGLSKKLTDVSLDAIHNSPYPCFLPPCSHTDHPWVGKEIKNWKQTLEHVAHTRHATPGSKVEATVIYVSVLCLYSKFCARWPTSARITRCALVRRTRNIFETNRSCVRVHHKKVRSISINPRLYPHIFRLASWKTIAQMSPGMKDGWSKFPPHEFSTTERLLTQDIEQAGTGQETKTASIYHDMLK
jgi:hypothetical protein